MLKKLSCRMLGILLCLLLGSATPALAAVPVITQQPENVAVAAGEKATVIVEVQGKDLTYEWWYAESGTNIFIRSDLALQKPNEYTVEMNAACDGCKLYCIVTDAYGRMVQSKTVMIGMLVPLAIISQPQNACAAKGETVSTFVEASGEGLTYAWWFANADFNKFAQSSISAPVYAQEMIEMRDGRRVYCVITDKYGQTVQTETVVLSMKTSHETQ